MTLALASFLCLLAQPLSTIVVQQYSVDSQNCETSYLTKTMYFWPVQNILFSQNCFENCLKGNVECNFNNKMILETFYKDLYFRRLFFHLSKSCKTSLLFTWNSKNLLALVLVLKPKTVWNSFKILDDLGIA